MRTEAGRCCDYPKCGQHAVLTVGLLLGNANEARELCGPHASEAIDLAETLEVAPRLSRICEYGVVLTLDEARFEIARAVVVIRRVDEAVAEARDQKAKDWTRAMAIRFVSKWPGCTSAEVADELGCRVPFASAVLGDLKRRGGMRSAGTPRRWWVVQVAAEAPAPAQRASA